MRQHTSKQACLLATLGERKGGKDLCHCIASIVRRRNEDYVRKHETSSWVFREVSKSVLEISMSISCVTSDINSIPKNGSLKQRTISNKQMQLQMKQDHNCLTAKCGTNIMHKAILRQIFQTLVWLLQKLLFLRDLTYPKFVLFCRCGLFAPILTQRTTYIVHPSLYYSLSWSWLLHAGLYILSNQPAWNSLCFFSAVTQSLFHHQLRFPPGVLQWNMYIQAF